MKNLFSSVQRLSIFFFILGIAVACKQPETIVVDRKPDTAPANDTPEEAVPEKQDAAFRQLNIGVSQPISSFDPLLASNRADMYAIQLIYEGLVRFNEDGKIIPAVAEEWAASNNNRTYTFHLRPDVFFHDSDIFGSGTGRKLTADDVKFVFKRMAKATVPDRAAQLFMDIEGFEAYHREQKYVFNDAYQQLDGIAGITAPNDTTVVFNLDNPDPDFLQKLATPFATIYPKEAVNTEGDFKAVGTGPFTFSQQANDSTFIFAKFQDYYSASDVELNRIDMIASDNETALWEAMEAGDIHYLPVLGPQLTQQLLASPQKLIASISDRYALMQAPASTEYTLRRYTGSNISKDTGADIAQLAETNLDSLFASLQSVIANIHFSTDESKLASRPHLLIRSTAPKSSFERVILQHLKEALTKQNIQLTIGNLHIPTRETGLFFTQTMPLIPSLPWESQPEILSFTVQPYSLSHQAVEGINSNPYSWWINLRDTQVPPLENIN